MIKTNPPADHVERLARIDPPPEAVTYVATGSTAVFGTRPGGKFTRVIPSAQEARMIARGAIARVEFVEPKSNASGTVPPAGKTLTAPEEDEDGGKEGQP